MSRIGAKPITLPTGVNVLVENGFVTVKGPKGEAAESVKSGTTVSLDGSVVRVSRNGDDRFARAAHGLMNRLIQSMVTGVSAGYLKKLEMVGTGYRAKMQGQNLLVSAGYSHPIEFKPLDGVGLACEGDTVIVVTGSNKRDVGEVAAKIRAIRPPEPYQGKGIRYQGEIIRRKAGKATKTSSG